MVSCCATLFYVLLCGGVLLCVMLCYVVLCCAILCFFVVFCRAIAVVWLCRASCGALAPRSSARLCEYCAAWSFVGLFLSVHRARDGGVLDRNWLAFVVIMPWYVLRVRSREWPYSSPPMTALRRPFIPKARTARE